MFIMKENLMKMRLSWFGEPIKTMDPIITYKVRLIALSLKPESYSRAIPCNILTVP